MLVWGETSVSEFPACFTHVRELARQTWGAMEVQLVAPVWWRQQVHSHTGAGVGVADRTAWWELSEDCGLGHI